MTPKISKAEIIEGYRVILYYSNGEIKEIDFSKYLSEPFYSKFNDYEYFKKFKILVDTLIWDDDVDISPEELYEFSVSAKLKRD